MWDSSGVITINSFAYFALFAANTRIAYTVKYFNPAPLQQPAY